MTQTYAEPGVKKILVAEIAIAAKLQM